MDQQIASRKQMAYPSAVIRKGRRKRVAAVDKDQAERYRPETGNRLRAGNDRDDRILQSDFTNRPAKMKKRVDPTRLRVQEVRVVIFLARLLLF